MDYKDLESRNNMKLGLAKLELILVGNYNSVNSYEFRDSLEAQNVTLNAI